MNITVYDTELYILYDPSPYVHTKTQIPMQQTAHGQFSLPKLCQVSTNV